MRDATRFFFRYKTFFRYFRTFKTGILHIYSLTGQILKQLSPSVSVTSVRYLPPLRGIIVNYPYSYYYRYQYYIHYHYRYYIIAAVSRACIVSTLLNPRSLLEKIVTRNLEGGSQSDHPPLLLLSTQFSRLT